MRFKLTNQRRTPHQPETYSGIEVTAIKTLWLACLHDQNKNGFFGCRLLSSQSEQSEKFSKSPDWLEKKPPLKKSHFCFHHVNRQTLYRGHGNPKRRTALTTQPSQRYVDSGMLTYKMLIFDTVAHVIFVVCYFCHFSNIIFFEAMHLNLCNRL